MLGHMGDTTDTIYDRAGGADVFLRLAQGLHRRCLADELLNHPFSNPGHPQHNERLAAYWAEVLGGPSDYTTVHDATETSMLVLHAEHIPPEMGDRFVELFVDTFDEAGVPDDAELRTALRDYLRHAMDNVLAHPDAELVPADAPMPHWSWDGPST